MSQGRKAQIPQSLNPHHDQNPLFDHTRMLIINYLCAWKDGCLVINNRILQHKPFVEYNRPESTLHNSLDKEILQLVDPGMGVGKNGLTRQRAAPPVCKTSTAGHPKSVQHGSTMTYGELGQPLKHQFYGGITNKL